MMDRRRALKLGAATLTGTLVTTVPAVVRAAVLADGPLLCRGVFDERFDEAMAFARALDSAGVATTGIRGDVARLWYEDLRDPLRRRRVPFAGLTDRAALFCLEELARDVGMCVAMRVDHLIDARGFVRHEASGSDVVQRAMPHLGSRAGFGSAMAALARWHAAGARGHVAAQKRTGPSAPHEGGAWVSWVIV